MYTVLHTSTHSKPTRAAGHKCMLGVLPKVPERRANEPVHRLSSTTLERHSCHTYSATHNKNIKVSGTDSGRKEETADGDSFLNNVEPELCSAAAPGAVCLKEPFALLLFFCGLTAVR